MLGIVESVVGVAGKVLDKFVEDKDLKTKLNAELKSQIVSLDLAQAQANIEQAKHPSVFIAGARPAIAGGGTGNPSSASKGGFRGRKSCQCY